ncbi:E3 ubiquitin-protein ligase UBR4 isoform X3 [Chrysoperla carnea]|uniref:E3 ubiquitin-protein ligase UBR4 isoform X3 n=1 Tax=Chrysoperla carnea TaxID=189513 RepID=UPI001D069E41|nr:E3 ubiquitin-protein ligase UBR4 isoform X3 [Chrysoperla carnea]
MAANSGGVEWSSIIKPILSATYGSFNKSDVLDLASAIIKSESEILSHSENYEIFYTSFATLAADYISTNAGVLSRNHISTVSQACRILLNYLLSRVKAYNTSELSSGADSGAVPPKNLLLAIRALCCGKGLLSNADQVALTTTMNSENLPPHITTKPPGAEKETPASKETVRRQRSDLSVSILEQLTSPILDGEGIVANKNVNSRPITSNNDNSQDNVSKSEASQENVDQASEIKKLLSITNSEVLQELRASEVLLDLSLKLPTLRKYSSKYDDTIGGKPFSLPSNHTETQAVRSSLSSMVSDITLVLDAISLPILEPLTIPKLQKLMTISGSAIYCAFWGAMSVNSGSSATTSVSPRTSSTQSTTTNTGQSTISKEDDLDTLAIQLVETVLEIFNYVTNTIKKSTRTGGHVLQNHVLIGAWLLVSGLQAQISASRLNLMSVGTTERERSSPREDKGRSPSKARDNSSRVNLLKVQQNFGVLSVALATKALSLMSELLDDLHIEISSSTVVPDTIEPAPLNITAESTALQRTVRLLSAAPINQMLYYLATISYRKACTLKRIQKHPPEGDTFSQSDSTTYYEDMISCSDETSTDEDDDSEPILGQWFEETIAPPENNDTIAMNLVDGQDKSNTQDRVNSIVPEKGEPHGFIILSTNVFLFMNKHFLCSRSAYLQKYIKSGLSEQQMVILAAIIQDLDRETARTETGTISVYFGATLGQLYVDFSQALARYTHNLITRNMLSTSMQTVLLSHLGVSPWTVDSNAPWPLQVYPRTLAVLSQILLMKPQQEKEASCISIWHRLVNTLVENVCNPPATIDSENEDLNVEHAQVLLYLFHALNLMQKKSVLLLIAGGVVRCSEVARPSKDTSTKVTIEKTEDESKQEESKDVVKLSEKISTVPTTTQQTPSLRDIQLLHLSRLLLLLEYAVRHLYDAPASLLQQIQWNLFISTGLIPSEQEKDLTKAPSRQYAPWKSIEDNYRKIGQPDEFSMKPRFYSIVNVELNNQDTPRLDGLACNFILGTPDKLMYPLLIDALLEIMNVANISTEGENPKLSFQGLCATQYCFTICWRLLQVLPPSTTYMEKLALGKPLPVGPLLLHSLIWGPRAAHKTFSRWLKDALVKQSIYTQCAEKLLNTVTDVVNTLQYDITMTKNTIIALKPSFGSDSIIPKESLPQLSTLILLDSVIAKVQIALIDEEVRESSKSAGNRNSPTSTELVQDIMPHVIQLAKAVHNCISSSLLYEMHESPDAVVQNNATPGNKYSIRELAALTPVLALCSSKHSLTESLANPIVELLPLCARNVLEKWKMCSLPDCSWTPYLNDIIPSESNIFAIVNVHISTLSTRANYSIHISLKRLLFVLVKFIGQHISKSDPVELKNSAIDLLIPLTLDIRTEFAHESAAKTLEKLIGDINVEEHQKRVYLCVLEHIYVLLINFTSLIDLNYSIMIDERILHDCLKFLEKLLDSTGGRYALAQFFVGDHNLVKVLMSVSSPLTSQQYSTKVLQFFNKLFQTADKNPSDISLEYLCATMSILAKVDSDKLQNWLRHVILGSNNMDSSVTSSNIQTPTIMTTAAVATTSTSPPAADDITKVDENGSKDAPTNAQQWNGAQVASSESNDSPSPTVEQKSLLQENSQLLQALTSYIVKECRAVTEDVSLTILKALLSIGSQVLSADIEGKGFPELLKVMVNLADARCGKGHQHLFIAAIDWLQICKQYLTQPDVLQKIESGQITGKHTAMLDSTCCLLSYIGDIISALIPQTPGTSTSSIIGTNRALSPPWEGEVPAELDPEWLDDVNEEEDSGAEDSDEDSLCNKLCTYTVTQKEFMNQHWYHCHTCRMLDGVGVCSVCARVCHKNHDLSYAKYGNFFCDCGAKEDGSCQALVKRNPQTSGENRTAASTSGAITGHTTYNTEHVLTSSLRRRPTSPITLDKIINTRDKNKIVTLAKQLEDCREALITHVSSSSAVTALVELADALVPAVQTSCQQYSPVGCLARAQKALEQLHTLPKKCVHSDPFMMWPTLGSQEGAFENVRMNYSGDQGQTIRQLLSAHMVRRVAMCCMSSPHGKRQHLAVSHEKGKITVLQLSALLKQADSTKRKLTLTRLASAPIPFTVLSLAANPANEDFLAVCGLKDCHVLTFSSTGSVSDHLVLHPQLETGNFIIRAIWLPGCQTQLALVTADFVKIYDLSKDALSPQFFFLVPSGKIRDCTFMYANGLFHILLMSSPGHIYYQALDDASSAKHGSFYVTNTLEVLNVDVNDDNGQVAGGGVSIYYSHTLQLLFFSYSQGKSFIAPLKEMNECLPVVFPINLTSATTTTTNSSSGAAAAGSGSNASVASGSVSGGNTKSNGNKVTNPQPLCQWMEIVGHPGLVCSVMQTSNNPVILMIKPNTILVQEIKIVPAKAKIMDMVALRHAASPSTATAVPVSNSTGTPGGVPASAAENRTTLILLCEDGSLRIYMAYMEQTGFWMSSAIQPVTTTLATKPVRTKKKILKSGKTTGQVTFPVDFFEHCQSMNDVEYGGNDLLQVYNAQQVKQRLNTTGMYVACTKATGFSMDIINNDNSMVMTGIRVLFGNQDIQRTPTYVEVFGRVIATTVTRSRWYDIPFTREESLQADKRITVIFGPSLDPDSVTMVDNIKVYGKTKDSFGWPDEAEESSSNIVAPVANPTMTNTDSDLHSPNQTQLTSLDKLISGVLEVLDSSFLLFGNSNEEKLLNQKTLALEMATKLLILPTPMTVQMQTKAVLSSLHTNKQVYHNFKDEALLTYVLESLNTMYDIGKNKDATHIDAEDFYRLVLIVRGIAVSRPQNIVRFTELHQNDHPTNTKESPSNYLLAQIFEVLWLLHSVRPTNINLVSVVVPGLSHAEHIIHAIVDIIHAYMICCDNLETTVTAGANFYISLLLSEDSQIAFSAKQAIIRVLKPKIKRRRVFIPSPPHCSTPGTSGIKTSSDIDIEKVRSSTTNNAIREQNESEVQYEVDTVEPMALLQGENIRDLNINPLEALLGGAVAGGFSPLLDIPPDADDETMVELAIALSLQDHELAAVAADPRGNGINAGPSASNGAATGIAGLSRGMLRAAAALSNHELQSLQAIAQQSVSQSNPIGQQAPETGHYSDTTASAGGSDDEGSTVATDGSTLRTSPAEQAGSAGSESGGSAVESITGDPDPDGDNDADTLDGTSAARLHSLRVLLLERLTQQFPSLSNVSGVRAIPFMQVILMLTSDLYITSEKDRKCLEGLLNALVAELHVDNPDTEDVSSRSNTKEVRLIIMRLLSVLMSRWKLTTTKQTDNSVFVSQTTATVLQEAHLINYCLTLLQNLLSYWRTNSLEETGGIALGGSLLKEHLSTPAPDMQPFFLRQYVKGHASDVFEAYPQLLTEMALRLPYQVQKHSTLGLTINQAFDSEWYQHLCEYMMTFQTPLVRRQVRKLLLYICGSKEKYRQLRDLHALESHVKAVEKCCQKGGLDITVGNLHPASLPYDSLVELMEHLKACLEIAATRTGNWQRFCLKHINTLSYLLNISYLLDEGVCSTILQLLQCAICPSSTSIPKKSHTNEQSTAGKSNSTATTSSSRKEREKSEESDNESKFEETNCATLVEQINSQVQPEILARFMKAFLLETNATNVRWQAHSLVLAIYKNSTAAEQERLLEILWKVWPQLPAYGRKAAQFVDLLGYFSLRTNHTGNQMEQYMKQAINVLRAQNDLLACHPNANLYAHLAQFVELDGYYLESEPCLVCNNPEVPFTSMKISSVKIDSKYTTTTQIVKLMCSHTISKISLRIGELKRTKMVRTINIYYNNRTVQAVVELKNKPAMWHKAKKVHLQSGQTEVKIDFPLPIVACNLMIEYADFYENIQASSENLQCPRCSAVVPANPGVCGNCGENVFQCHKCRAINYDEKDPFLCHACGFCKYAKFDYTMFARPCCAVEPIENDEDRKKTVSNINTLLEKADRVYKQLIGNKPTLELLLLQVSEYRIDRNEDTPISNTITVGSTQVNKAIQLLAQRYCGDCKTSFEELSKIIQRVLACRKELVAYDRKHRDCTVPVPRLQQNSYLSDPSSSSGDEDNTLQNPPLTGRCYGCASAATEHCLTLLKALAGHIPSRLALCDLGLVQELVENNLRKGSVQMQEEVRQLLCMLTRDNEPSTRKLCELLMERITLSLRNPSSAPDFGSGVRHEIMLLAAMVQKEDDCWEMKLRSMVQLFLMACKDSKSPLVMDSVILPCLKIMQELIEPPQPISKKNKDKSVNNVTSIKRPDGLTLNLNKWLENDGKNTFEKWVESMPHRGDDGKTVRNLLKEESRIIFVSEKYFRRWRIKALHLEESEPLRLSENAWIKRVLFNPSSRLARQVACSIVESMCEGVERKKEVLLLLTSYLSELRGAGESAAEFLVLYQQLISDSQWKQFLAVHGVLKEIASLLVREIDELHRLEETTLTSDLAQDRLHSFSLEFFLVPRLVTCYALKQLTCLLASFLEDSAIRRQYKGRLVGAVLNGYLSLRRLVVQRTRLVDDTQDKLLELLEEMTTGTEEETKAFMSVCIETVQRYSPQDVRTPVFIFERLCSIIYPEENDIGEFFLTLEKDPQQEDFLQGRMLGNPYSSNEAGLGPLMRDVKNKICQDCELVALLEDDNGMELLVNNKIMSLDLPVKEVFKKVWLADGGEGDSMRIVYRMRGLLGDATEEFVETLNAKTQEAVDNEQVYRMANVLADCGGLRVMLDRLAAIQNISRARPLLQVLLKLFKLSVKVKKNIEQLAKPEMEAISVFLHVLQRCLEEPEASQAGLTEQLLDIMETILSHATSQSLDNFLVFSQTFGGPEYIQSLLSCTTSTSVRNNQSVIIHLTRVLAALVYGNADRMKLLCDHFASVLDFNKFDYEHNADDDYKLEMFCVLTTGIERNAIGNTLKDYIISLDIVKNALEYIKMHAPFVKPTFLRTDSDELKEFISKPALKYILRFLTGLATEHESTQLAVSADVIPIIHRLEQVSSDEHVGSLAENLLEALKSCDSVAQRVQQVRDHTRNEKKRLAMAMREKQLGALGMRTNDKGQVTAKSTILQQMEELGEETGLVCCICREGYRYQPAKVLAIYTFSKRCLVEDFDCSKPRKMLGCSTVTHFNVVHVDCHMNAVRLARARDEWDSAALQNANTKCNGLLPLWGPGVPESAFASCLARHNTYLQEATGNRDIGHTATIHDLKLLLLRFAQEKPFHEDTGGGGPQSNMHLIPYLIHMALYVINTTRSATREYKNLCTFLDCTSVEKWIHSSYEIEGPLYWAIFSILLLSPNRWRRRRLSHLKRLIIIGHVRHIQPEGPCPNLNDKTIKDYSVYKPYLIFFGLIDGIYNNFFKKVVCGSDEQWPSVLADYIRYNDESLLKASERLLANYREELLPCASFMEFCDVCELLGDIQNPDTYIADILKGV